MGNRTFLLLVVATYFAIEPMFYHLRVPRWPSHREFQGRRQKPGCHGEKPSSLQIAGF